MKRNKVDIDTAAWKYTEHLIVKEKKKIIDNSVPEGILASITPMIWPLNGGICK